MGVQITVPKPVSLDDYYEIPDKLLEIRSRTQVREHQWAFENANQLSMDNRIEEIRNSITRFYPDSSQRLIEHRPDELVEIARKCLAGKPSFREAVNAALMLDLCGQPEGFQYIKKRFLDQHPADKKDQDEFFHRFRKRDLTADPEILEFLKAAAADEESEHHWRACHLLYDAGVDAEPLLRLKRALASENPIRRSESVVWLMDNKMDPHALDLVEQFLENSTRFELGFILKRMRTSSEARQVAIAQQVEILMCERLAVAAKDDSEKPPSIHSQLDAWQVLGENCTELSSEFFLNVGDHIANGFAESKYQRIAIACRALKRLGRQADAVAIVKEHIEKTAATANFYDNRIVLFDATEEVAGRDITVEICQKQLRAGFDRAAIEKLGHLFEATNNEQIVNAIVESASKESGAKPPALRFHTLKSITRIGSKRLVELWAKLDARDVNDDSNFHRHWACNKTTREQLVGWINKELQPATKLTKELVLKNPKYNDGNHWIWHDVMWDAIDKDEDAKVPIETDQEFAMIALAHSGYGNLAYDDRYPLEGVVDVMCGEIADIESEEFRVSSHSYDWDGPLIFNSFVVNDRLYKFNHKEGYNGADDRYSVQAAAEILNAVAIRQRLTGRFFCYGNEWGVTLVMYLTPDQARDLEKKFGIEPMVGFEYYLTN